MSTKQKFVLEKFAPKSSREEQIEVAIRELKEKVDAVFQQWGTPVNMTPLLPRLCAIRAPSVPYKEVRQVAQERGMIKVAVNFAGREMMMPAHLTPQQMQEAFWKHEEIEQKRRQLK